MIRLIVRICLAGLCLSAFLANAEDDTEEFAASPTWEAAKEKTDAWVESRGLTDKVKLTSIETLWAVSDENPANPNAILERVIQSFAIADEGTQAFLATLVRKDGPVDVKYPTDLLNDKSMGSFYHANLRVYYARYLTQQDMIEEALDVLADATLADTVDPAGLLFYRATCLKHLGLREASLATLDQLLKRVERAPERYLNLGALMKYDLEALQEKSLDDIANRMNDSQRRLAIARAGAKTQAVQKKLSMTSTR